MFGKIELAEFEALSKAPQEAASALCVFDGEITGASYKPILYLGKQVAKGIDYFFIAERTFADRQATRHVVAVTVHGINGEYEILNIEEIL